MFAVVKEEKHKSKKRNKKHIQCYKCKKMGHYKSECRSKFNNDKGDKKHKHEQANLTTDFVFMQSDQSSQPSCDWVIDCASTCHVSPYKQLFDDLRESETCIQTTTGRTTTKFKGTITLKVQDPDGKINSITLTDVVYAPDSPANLLSTQILDRRGFMTTFGKKEGLAVIQDRQNGYKLITGTMRSRQYIVDGVQRPEQSHLNQSGEPSQKSRPSQLELWHRRMGHLNYAAVKKLHKEHGNWDIN